MTISYQWLMEYLPAKVSIEELSHILTSIGLEVEGVESLETIPGGLEGLLIGEVLTCEKHPNADKLSVTTVNIGEAHPLNIVCGAPNVATGQKVVVATVGTTVHPTSGEPFLIKKAKIRGADSEGMICAEDEIGLGDSHAGIIILPNDATVGMTAKAYYNIPTADTAIHIGLTPNRSDANSHMGVAKDVCAYLSHHWGELITITSPKPVIPNVTDSGAIQVAVEAAAACPRYAGIELNNVKVGESPQWLQQRLRTIGIRSINNVVDITNYVLHEYGQPLHAFDASKINGGITVKFLPEGTLFKGLDDKERVLRGEDLAICDENGPLALGGVFGGADSGITEATTHLFLESAYFNPSVIRRASLHHNLRTDAATHFEKGVDINNVLPALVRAAQLITEIAGGNICSAITDIYPQPVAINSVAISYAYINKLAGKVYKSETVKNILSALGCSIGTDTDTGITITPPSNKTDITQPADVVEEILRIDGLDNIALTGRMDIALTRATPDGRDLKEHVAELLCGMGMSEIVTNSIVNSTYYPDNDKLVRMINSLSIALDVMRPSMLESGLEVIAYNCNRRNTNLQLFEFGHVYSMDGGEYLQETRLSLWVTGNTREKHWNQQVEPIDLFYLKGIVASLVTGLGLKNIKTIYDTSSATPEVVMQWKGKLLARIAVVSPKRLKEFDVKQEVYFADLNWQVWLEANTAAKTKYVEVPKFPAVQRDLAIVLDKKITYGQVQEVTEALKLPGLQSFGLFDVFESEKLGEGKKSFALNFTFQLNDRTLTDAETEQLMQQITDAYTTKLHAQMR